MLTYFINITAIGGIYYCNDTASFVTGYRIISSQDVPNSQRSQSPCIDIAYSPCSRCKIALQSHQPPYPSPKPGLKSSFQRSSRCVAILVPISSFPTFSSLPSYFSALEYGSIFCWASCMFYAFECPFLESNSIGNLNSDLPLIHTIFSLHF